MPQRESDRQRAKAIQRLNDHFRQKGVGNGAFLFTLGVQALSDDARAHLIQAIQTYDAFSPDNDPYHEHDFGTVAYRGQDVFWKIDYYNLSCDAHSPDAADSAVTYRVLTVMLASEY